MNIDALRDKYKHHEYMKQKVEDYLANLPVLMASLEEEYDKKQQKKQSLLEKREEFITFFFSQYSFFYIPQTEVFVQQTIDYKVVHEDTILHLICSLLDKYPVTPYLDSRESFIRWMNFIHNKVNVAIEKPEMALDEAMIQYYELYKPKAVKDAAERKRREKYAFLIIAGVIACLGVYLLQK